MSKLFQDAPKTCKGSYEKFLCETVYGRKCYNGPDKKCGEYVNEEGTLKEESNN